MAAAGYAGAADTTSKLTAANAADGGEDEKKHGERTSKHGLLEGNFHNISIITAHVVCDIILGDV